ncbi:Ku protein, partial [Streptomyces sp. NPDC048425]
ATFVMRNREYLVAVKADEGILTLHTLHWADEIRDPRKIDTLPDQIEVDKREVEMAEQLIDALTMEWKPEEFHDTYQDEVAKLVESKRTGKTMEKAEPPAESTNVVDLMEALRASVDRAKKPEDHEAGKESAGAGSAPTGIQKGAQRRRPKKRAKATQQGSHSPSESADLDSLTKAELYQRAAEEDVPGRSSMSRDELVKSLSAKRHRQRKSSA